MRDEFVLFVCLQCEQRYTVSATIKSQNSACGCNGMAMVTGTGDVTFTFSRSALSNNGTDVFSTLAPIVCSWSSHAHTLFCQGGQFPAILYCLPSALQTSSSKEPEQHISRNLFSASDHVGLPRFFYLLASRRCLPQQRDLQQMMQTLKWAWAQLCGSVARQEIFGGPSSCCYVAVNCLRLLVSRCRGLFKKDLAGCVDAVRVQAAKLIVRCSNLTPFVVSTLDDDMIHSIMVARDMMRDILREV